MGNSFSGIRTRSGNHLERDSASAINPYVGMRRRVALSILCVSTLEWRGAHGFRKHKRKHKRQHVIAKDVAEDDEGGKDAADGKGVPPNLRGSRRQALEKAIREAVSALNPADFGSPDFDFRGAMEDAQAASVLQTVMTRNPFPDRDPFPGAHWLERHAHRAGTIPAGGGDQSAAPIQEDANQNMVLQNDEALIQLGTSAPVSNGRYRCDPYAGKYPGPQYQYPRPQYLDGGVWTDGCGAHWGQLDRLPVIVWMELADCNALSADYRPEVLEMVYPLYKMRIQIRRSTVLLHNYGFGDSYVDKVANVAGLRYGHDAIEVCGQFFDYTAGGWHFHLWSRMKPEDYDLWRGDYVRAPDGWRFAYAWNAVNLQKHFRKDPNLTGFTRVVGEVTVPEGGQWMKPGHLLPDGGYVGLLGMMVRSLNEQRTSAGPVYEVCAARDLKNGVSVQDYYPTWGNCGYHLLAHNCQDYCVALAEALTKKSARVQNEDQLWVRKNLKAAREWWFR